MFTRLVCAAIVAAAFLYAQEFRATLQGTIHDSTQAVVPSAEVTLKNIATAVEGRAAPDAAGHYLFQFLPPGTYSLTTRAAGFKTDVRDGIQLSLGDNTRLDVDLAVG